MNAGPLAEELARLAKENSELRLRLEGSQSSEKYGGLEFQEMKSLLDQIAVEENEPGVSWKASGADLVSKQFSLLRALWVLRERLSGGWLGSSKSTIGGPLRTRGLVSYSSSPRGFLYELTDEGRRFLNRLEVEMRASSMSHASAQDLAAAQSEAPWTRPGEG